MYLPQRKSNIIASLIVIPIVASANFGWFTHNTILMKELDINLKNYNSVDSSFCVLFVDLDNFKYINDNYDHHTGDIILKETVTRLRQSLRDNDLIARFVATNL